MYKTLISILLFVVSFIAESKDSLVVIAFPKEAKISDYSCSHFLKNKDEFCHDGVVELKYEIDEILLGEYEGKFIQVIDFVHKSGFPSYLQEFPIVFFLEKENGYFFLSNQSKTIDMGELEGVCLDGLSNFNSIKKGEFIEVKNDICSKAIEIEKFKALLNNG